MSLWGNTANSSGLGAPKWSSWPSANAVGVDLYANTTLGSFGNNVSVGVFGVDIANPQGLPSPAVSPGWVQVVHMTGYIKSLALSNNGLTFANGETVLLSGGSQNTTGVATTNSIGGLVSMALGANGGGGGFTNVAAVTAAFQRQRHLNNLNITAGGLGYSNSDYVIVSNSGATGLITGNATVTTNTLGGLLTTTLTSVGLFGNAVTNSQVLFTVFAANGAASNGSTATFTANLTTSTNGGVTPTMGGNAGRVRYECLAELSSMAGQAGVTIPIPG